MRNYLLILSPAIVLGCGLKSNKEELRTDHVNNSNSNLVEKTSQQTQSSKQSLASDDNLSNASNCGIIRKNQVIKRGFRIKSCHNSYELIFQNDGNIVINDLVNNKSVWSTQTGPLKDQNSENTLIQNIFVGVASNPVGLGNAALLARNGIFVLTQAKDCEIRADKPISDICNTSNLKAYTSADNFKLINTNANYLMLQDDGNLVAYSDKDSAIWSWKTGQRLKLDFPLKLDLYFNGLPATFNISVIIAQESVCSLNARYEYYDGTKFSDLKFEEFPISKKYSVVMKSPIEGTGKSGQATFNLMCKDGGSVSYGPFSF